MPADKRLYMTFPNDFADHPKIMVLSDNAFRTFVAMNGYSRAHNLDGRIPTVVANSKWRAKSLLELQSNHPERPSVLLDGDCYVIHNYAEHQLTTAAIESLREKRSQAGQKGGKATASAKANAAANEQQPASKRPAEKEKEKEIPTSNEVGVRAKRATRIPEPFIVTADMRSWAASRVPGVFVDASTEKFVNYWRAKTRDATKLDWRATWDNWLISDFERLSPVKRSKDQQAVDVLEMGRRMQADSQRKELGS